jgi:transposase
MQIDVSSMLSLPDGLEVASLAVADTVLALHIVATAKSSPCPLCAHAAIRVRSYYTRLVADVPCGGRQVQLILHVRKFRCETADCPRQVFTERLAPFLEPWARMTTRLSKTIEAIGLATCGELGERFAPHLGIQTSPTTILRRTMALPTSPPEHVSQLGIDDWSFRRGRKFGTILVDLATHKVIELLPDRTTETAAAWMQAHPEIEIVSRDRGGDYAAAARKGAPQAQQVADRFHLAQNLTDRIEVVLSRCCPEIRKVFRGRDPSSSLEDQSEGNKKESTQESDDWSLAPGPLAGNAHLAHQVERADRLQQLTELCAQGVTQKEIAHRLGIGERTVRYWLTRGIPYGTPESRGKRRKDFDPYASYVEKRFRQGCHNGQELWHEITAQGYKGSCRTVYRFLESLRENASSIEGKAQRSQSVPESRVQHFSAQKAVWLFVRDPCDLDEKEQEELTAIRQASPTAKTLYGLAQEFMYMIRHLKGERLDDWLSCVKASQIPELQPLAKSIKQDKAAVLAGLTLSHSNGVVEGKVNKLKLIKRMMFGRAGFALLRQRVLHAM